MRSGICRADGVGCLGYNYNSGEACTCLCHSEYAPWFETNEEVKAWHEG